MNVQQKQMLKPLSTVCNCNEEEKGSGHGVKIACKPPAKY
jgi:hypothetical protein